MIKRLAVVVVGFIVGLIVVPWTFVLFVYHSLAHFFGLPCPF